MCKTWKEAAERPTLWSDLCLAQLRLKRLQKARELAVDENFRELPWVFRDAVISRALKHDMLLRLLDC